MEGKTRVIDHVHTQERRQHQSSQPTDDLDLCRDQNRAAIKHGVTTENITQGIWTTSALLSPGSFPAAMENSESKPAADRAGERTHR